jgi:signal transduction histidine kinase
MSLRWKYLIVVQAAVAATAALFTILHKLEVVPREGGALPLWAAVIAMALAVTIMAAYRSFVAKPLRDIADGAAKLAEGERGHRIHLDGGDELATIAAAINRMADRVAKVQAELETKVAERTEDLQAVLEEVHERSRIVEEVNLRLADADQRKSEFLTNVSHELRTPLNSVLGFLRLVLEGLYEDEAERREYLENARLAATHLSALVADVLAVARLEAGRVEVHRRAIHPADVICDVLRMLDASAKEKRLDVRMEADGACVALADEPKLRQVLVNLVGNAIQFTDRGTIVVRAQEEDESVRIEVEDTGVGFPQEEAERIFEKFHQLDTSPTRAHGGAGLGLPIARELVRLMGGTIHARSEGPGRGAQFVFTLPAVPMSVRYPAHA